MELERGMHNRAGLFGWEIRDGSTVSEGPTLVLTAGAKWKPLMPV